MKQFLSFVKKEFLYIFRDTWIRKCSLITSHTARRTAATNMYLAGIAAARIMLFTGHQTEQAFFRYIRIGREENAEVLGMHEFFRGAVGACV